MDKQLIISEIKTDWKDYYKQLQIQDEVKHEKIDIINHISDLFTVGPYYYFVFNFETFEIEFISKNVEEILEEKIENIKIEKLLELCTDEDLKALQNKEQIAYDFLYNKIEKEDIQKYKVTYLNRIITKKGTKKIILHQSQVIEKDSNGRLIRVFCIHTDVTYMEPKMDHKITFVSSSLPSYYAYDLNDYKLTNMKSIFSKREIEIINLIAKGYTEIEIGEELCISPLTVKTHKKKMFAKANVKNTAQLVADCIRNDVIQ
ncbi:response regulator transcription factor [Aureivirga sp. CE67]|uniref:response regulator transcription factor n=1 Tax=Aureivirga sp. CE67 TaxID=1788983 RepID=UPI0018CBB6EF|nr:helix-turn-helix transcriptional regulator [Aureivirga sp. CE67]